MGNTNTIFRHGAQSRRITPEEAGLENTLDSLNQNLTLSVFNAQKAVQDANLAYLHQFFDIEGDEEKGLEEMILTPKTIRVRVGDEVQAIPICSLVNVHFMDVKDVHIKTAVEIKQMQCGNITTCNKHKKSGPVLELDINMTSIDVSENVARFIHKYHL